MRALRSQQAVRRRCGDDAFEGVGDRTRGGAGDAVGVEFLDVVVDRVAANRLGRCAQGGAGFEDLLSEIGGGVT
jgi:hypothetical protein